MDFDPKLGIKRFQELLRSRHLQTPPDLPALEARLQKYERDARRYGSSDREGVEWAKIIDGLIEVVAEADLGVSFNDLCQRQFTQREPRIHRLPKGGSEDDDDPAPAPNFGRRQNWAVFVGANSYDDQKNYHTLQVCVADATALMQQFASNGFSTERMQLITDTTQDNYPSRGNILNTLQTTAAATEPDDLLIFYYSGHGDVGGNESYLVPRDGWAASLKDTAISVLRVKQIMRKAPARNKVIILDTCHAGAPIGSKGKTHMSPAFIRHVFEEAEGIAILSSCTRNQLSYQSEERGQSAYTYFLLQALRGQADREEKGVVTVRDLNNYVTNKVKAWAAAQKCVQSPTISAEMIGEIIVCSYAQTS